jgi:hypothetical protein
LFGFFHVLCLFAFGFLNRNLVCCRG